MRAALTVAGYLSCLVCMAMMLGCVGAAGRLSQRFRTGRSNVTTLGPTETRAVVFADLDGFTALAERDGDGRAADVADRLTMHARRACVGGTRLVKTMGDAVMLVADDVQDAVLTAVRLSRLVTDDAALPLVAVGISHGPCVQRRGDVFGATVNLAARIADRARPGEIWCPAGVELSAQQVGLMSSPVGTVALDGIRLPVALHRLGHSPNGHAGLAPNEAVAVAM